MRTTSLIRQHGGLKRAKWADVATKWRRCARAGYATLALAGLTALAGCAPTPAPTPALPDGVTATLQQLRSDAADRTAQVRVANDTDRDLEITRVELRDDWFDGPAVRDRDSTIAAGRTVDLRIDLPPSVCDGEPDTGARESVVVLTMRDDTVHRVTADDPLGFTARLHEKECLAQDAAAVADLTWEQFVPSAAGAPATLRLRIAPAGGDGALRIVEVHPTNLLQFTAGSPAPFAVGLDVDATAPAASVDVPLWPLRCDPHAVLEDKRGTVITVGVDVDGTAGLIELPAGDEQRGQILAWVAQWCGFG
ncbi:hypothetical protein H9651_07885 [Microbacterium sp. Sa4CUA7]|uniref:Lipoprotein n=1 Tax=Microbacterium pullorum TaxID=2762236 RepID=A0ABR8S250_9MICO|nr:hypothetical protein [Microbacterium pullorum]MBD7957557.1 hypothetical protein [Microbacterium pullorum]